MLVGMGSYERFVEKVSKIGTSFFREKVFTSIVRVTVNLEVVGQFALFHNR